MTQMTLSMKEKQIHRYRELIGKVEAGEARSG